MKFLFELYRGLTVRFRIILLCTCYSFCIIAAVSAGHARPLSFAIASTAVFVLLGLLFCALLFWTINEPLQRILAYLSKMTNGDLTQEIVAERNNELSVIIRSIRSLQMAMREIISHISQSSEKVAIESRQLQKTSDQIATGAKEVASQTVTVATAGEEMSATSSYIAQNCQTAADGAQRAYQLAHTGAEALLARVRG